MQQIREVYPKITMAISNPHSDYREGPAAYLEAKYAFEARFIRGNGHLLRFDELNNDPEDDANYPTEIMDRLRRSFLESDLESMDATLDGLKEYLGKMNESLYMFRTVYYDIISVLNEEYFRRHRKRYHEQYSDIFALPDCLSLEEMGSGASGSLPETD